MTFEPRVPVASAVLDPAGANTTLWGIPGSFVVGGNYTTGALAINTDNYCFLDIRRTVVLSAIGFNVSTAPASNAVAYLGIYRADSTWQTCAEAPLLDTSISVASAFTGLKSATISVTLKPGLYVSIINVDVAMSVRFAIGGPMIGSPDLSGSSWVSRGTRSRTAGSFPTPGLPWTGNGTTNTGPVPCIFYKWTCP